MNFSRALTTTVLIFCCTSTFNWRALAQGSLTPPGAPAPTFKTLSQVEPRYPIADYQTNLTLSGSYYLVTNLVSGTNTNDGINIRTNVHDITIDLNGFAIINTNGAGSSSPVGVRISEGTNVVIRNGQIIGFDRGVRGEGLFYGVVVENVHIRNCRRAGIEANGVVGDGSQTMAIRNCVIEGMDGTGEATSVTVDGITILNSSVVVQNCIVRDIVAAGTGIANCIDAQSPTNSFVDNNLLSNADVGIKVTGGGTRLYYRNNLAAGIATPFSAVSGGVDRGGNQ
jgi:Right handed beta helix region